MNAMSAQPQYSMPVHIDGIFGGNSQGRIQEVVQMLKNADQAIDDVQITSHNGYGKVLGANVLHHPNFAVNQAVLQNAKVQSVAIDGIWGGDSCVRINQAVGTLHAAEQRILNVEVSGENGYGKILGANIYYISNFAYQNLMQQPVPAPAPAHP